MSSYCTYNQSKAYTPLYYAYAAYCDEPLINDWSCKWCSQASNTFQIESVINLDYLQAFIGFDEKANEIVISFRGTHNYEDWLKNINYCQISYPNVRDAYVHEGFYNAYQQILEKGLIISLQTLLSNHPNSENILITGHSLGGALSELCALDLIDNQRITKSTNISIYTFGCPRWANRELAHYFNALPNIQSNWRLVNRDDPVAIVPGKFLGKYGFYHTATEIYYTDFWHDLRYTVCDGTGEDNNCAYNLWTGESNAHLWYLNIHEDCGVNDEATRPYHESVSVPVGSDKQTEQSSEESMEYGNNFRVDDTHWKLSLILIGIGFAVAMIYYSVLKICQRRGGYTSIRTAKKEQKSELQNYFHKKHKPTKVKKNLMKLGLLQSDEEVNDVEGGLSKIKW